MNEPIQDLYLKPPAWLDQFPLLHQSVAGELINRSPLHAWFKAFNKTEEEYDERTTLGQIAHALLLGGDEIVSVDAEDWRTKAAKEQREEARSAGKLPILAKKLNEAKNLVELVKDLLANRAQPITFTGINEPTAVWKNPFGVWCCGRIDHVIVRKTSAMIYDFKFCATAGKKECENRFISYGYDIQAAAYTQAIEAIYPDLAGHVKITYLFIETDPPHAMRVMPLAGPMRTSGSWRWGKACETWKECLETYGTETPWPAFRDDYEPAECPAWALNEQIAKEQLAQHEEMQEEPCLDNS